MVISKLYEDESEWIRHSSAIEDLAKDLKVSVEEVAQNYEKALRDLKENARIKEFLPLLTIRRVREIIKKVPSPPS